MNIFKNRTFKWWQVGLLKTALLFLGIAIGAHWSEFFAPYLTALVVVGLLLGFYIAYVTVVRN